ncbi:hypothetical protein [Aneurinibacillus aneurinilyticus]|uniref:hypothetical protein n=1 Tax=Aneurinibacillus aneurinilyticus TaxID=1391 RepID=UPI0035262CC9
MTKGQRACIVLNTYEAEERRKAKNGQGKRHDLTFGSNGPEVSERGTAGTSNFKTKYRCGSFATSERRGKNA